MEKYESLEIYCGQGRLDSLPFHLSSAQEKEVCESHFDPACTRENGSYYRTVMPKIWKNIFFPLLCLVLLGITVYRPFPYVNITCMFVVVLHDFWFCSISMLVTEVVHCQ